MATLCEGVGGTTTPQKPSLLDSIATPLWSTFLNASTLCPQVCARGCAALAPSHFPTIDPGLGSAALEEVCYGSWDSECVKRAVMCCAHWRRGQMLMRMLTCPDASGRVAASACDVLTALPKSTLNESRWRPVISCVLQVSCRAYTVLAYPICMECFDSRLVFLSEIVGGGSGVANAFCARLFHRAGQARTMSWG